MPVSLEVQRAVAECAPTPRTSPRSEPLSWRLIRTDSNPECRRSEEKRPARAPFPDAGSQQQIAPISRRPRDSKVASSAPGQARSRTLDVARRALEVSPKGLSTNRDAAGDSTNGRADHPFVTEPRRRRRHLIALDRDGRSFRPAERHHACRPTVAPHNPKIARSDAAPATWVDSAIGFWEGQRRGGLEEPRAVVRPSENGAGVERDERSDELAGRWG